MIENYPYNSTHLLKSLDWLDRLAPDASEAVRLATLTHDMERAFGGPDAIPIKMNDRAYEEAHSNRSARIVGEWLRANGADAELVRDVEELIRVHEWGGSPDADLVQAADSLSFLETNIDLMLGFVKNGQVLQGRHRAQVRPDVRAHSAARGERAGAADVGAARRRALGSDPRDEYRVQTHICVPESLDELLALLRAHGTGRPAARRRHRSAGAHEKRRSSGPRVVVDLKRVAELRADVARDRRTHPHRRARR